MRNKKTLVILALAFVILILVAYLLYNHFGKSEIPHQLLILDEKSDVNSSVDSGYDGNKNTEDDGENSSNRSLAPDFWVYNEKGEQIKLSDFKGKPTVVNFWASWCGPCKSEMPDFNELYGEMGDSINFVMVNMTDGSRETVEKASEFVKSRKYDFPVYYDTDMDAANVYSVYSIPATYFIDSKGTLVAKASGALDKATLLKGIEMIK